MYATVSQAVSCFDILDIVMYLILGVFEKGSAVLDICGFSPGSHNLTLIAFDQFDNTGHSIANFISPGTLI